VRLLIIEKSATLRHLLVRTLRTANLTEVTIADGFRHGELLLKQPPEDQKFDAVIMGVPASVTPEFESLLEYLSEPETWKVPVLLLSHEENAHLTEWNRIRPASEYLLWASFADIPGAMSKLAPVKGEHPTAFHTRILFVDDSKSVRESYRKILEDASFSVVTAATVQEGFKAAQEEMFDLAIIDYFLPDSTGDVLCTRLRENPQTASITTAIITGAYREGIIKKCLEAGAIECMFKNEAKELFLTRVRTLTRTIEARESVEAERRRLDGILCSVGDGVYGVDNDGRVTFINPAGSDLLGYEGQDLISELAFETLHYAREDGSPKADTECPLRQAYFSGDPMHAFETVFWHKERRAVPVECTVFPLSIQDRREGSVIVFRDIAERKSIEQLRWDATHDPLTGLANRQRFAERLADDIRVSKESESYHALLYLDLDRFSFVNETAGNATGDQVLAQVGASLSAQLTGTDMLARLSADKFVILIHDVELEDVFTVADDFRAAASQCTFEAGGKKRSVTASLGVALVSRDAESTDQIMEEARVACMIAKKKGRDRTHVYVPEHDYRVVRDLNSGWTRRLRDALKNDRFIFCCQPIVPTADLKADQFPETGHLWPQVIPEAPMFEVLLRMVGDDGRLLPASQFVPMAERVNVIPEIDLWVISGMLRWLTAMERAPAVFSINISNLTMQDAQVLPLVRSLLDGPHVDPRCIVFELTETSEITNLEAARKFIEELKAIGCRFALDDFGTGFSSFAHLKHLPVDFIKIDGVFVQNMAQSAIDRTMVTSIHEIAHSLGLQTVAEFVGSAETARLLKEAGVDYLQGSYVGAIRRLDELDFGGMTAKIPNKPRLRVVKPGDDMTAGRGPV